MSTTTETDVAAVDADGWIIDPDAYEADLAETRRIASAERAALAVADTECSGCGVVKPRNEMHSGGGVWFCTPCGFGE